MSFFSATRHTVVEGGSAADPGIPDPRMVELEHGGIEYDRERSLTDQHSLDHHLILEQKHGSAGMKKMGTKFYLRDGNPGGNFQSRYEVICVQLVSTALSFVAVLRRWATASGVVS